VLGGAKRGYHGIGRAGRRLKFTQFVYNVSVFAESVSVYARRC
jgi:hypothetical protein